MNSKNNEILLKGANLEYFISDDELLDKLINKFFFKDRTRYFINNSWNVIELSNDYFIESANFSLVKELMKLSNDDDLLFTDLTIPVAYYKLGIAQDINNLRQFIDEKMLFFYEWYFISPSEKWACISAYDYNSLFVGYDPSFEPQIEKNIQNNPNFIKYLKKNGILPNTD